MCARNHVPAMGAHAIEIDLSFGDPPRLLQRLGVGARAGDFARHRLDLRRDRRVRQK